MIYTYFASFVHILLRTSHSKHPVEHPRTSAAKSQLATVRWFKFLTASFSLQVAWRYTPLKACPRCLFSPSPQRHGLFEVPYGVAKAVLPVGRVRGSLILAHGAWG